MQTGGAGACAAAQRCSTLTVNGVNAVHEILEGGTPGTAETNLAFPGSGADRIAVFFDGIPDADIDWDGGDWIIRLNVTTTIMNITWETVTICRLNSGCTNQASILADVTGLGISLNSAGVKSTTQTGGAQTPSANDKFIVILGYSNSFAMSQSFGYTPDQNITTPFSRPVTGRPRRRTIISDMARSRDGLLWVPKRVAA